MSAAVLSLQKARESVQVCPLEGTRHQRVALRTRQLADARVEFASVLPIEGETGREVIRQRIELLERATTDPTFEERYPYLSMEVLGWRNDEGFPKLVPFSIDNPSFSIEISLTLSYGYRWEAGGSIQQLPRAMAKVYDDILRRFAEECEKDCPKGAYSWKKSISSRFNGVMPQWVREKISCATADFSISTPRVEIEKIGWLRKREVVKTDVATNIFLIVEVDNWVVNKEVILRPDPLVVGYKAGCLWLICSFDETPLEEYVRREFIV